MVPAFMDDASLGKRRLPGMGCHSHMHGHICSHFIQSQFCGWMAEQRKINKYSALKRENVFRSGDSQSFWSSVLQVFKGTWPQKAPSEWRYLLLHVYLSDLEPCCRSLERQCCFSTGLSSFDYVYHFSLFLFCLFVCFILLYLCCYLV